MMSRILTSFGHTVRVAHTMADAQAHIDREHFDLLLSDLNLPDGSGHDLMSYARAQRAMPGIALTGYCADNEHVTGHESGFSAHLVKPVDIVQLEATIRRVIQNDSA